MTHPERQSLMELAERCEAAEGPDRILDGDIAIALFNLDPPEHESARRVLISHGSKPGDYEISAISGVSLRGSYPYTASLDAAMTLVPEGWRWSVDSIGKATVQDEDDWQDGYAASPSLALCAAALRARSTADSGGEE